MKILSNVSKPKLSNAQPALCTFRSSKGYLWGVVRDRLQLIQSEIDRPLHILDAACHALITRKMFPVSANYYGLDISSSRLASAFKSKRTSDTLYRADLSRNFQLNSMFDVVVSCNTMSHLPFNQQKKALRNLVSCCAKGGDMLVNFTISEELMSFTSLLLNDFISVEPIYFDSFLSHRDECADRISSSNINHKISINEVNIPNDASLHRQVLFHAHQRLSGDNNVGSAPISSDKVIVLSSLPDVSVLKFSDDSSLLKNFPFDHHKDIVIFTSYLYYSDYGRTLKQSFPFQVYSLDLDFTIPPSISRIIILGLELGWSDDEAQDRLSINRLKELSGISVVFAMVDSRANPPCPPSLVARDY